ncbi:hypothetical protein [Salipiger mucosus]|uniref:PEP-CTERM sorting domain-containing protein n=1 Tax=Salipiger mucosus DSM 16094 TaxID=1123237 RepID=S9RCV7_9RHOB|nr:hypothetical protein [Salipiger mucosus]EPX75960.1 hypothetical protein Salmuc_05345 [Salipiger mucosus DSM 16094]
MTATFSDGQSLGLTLPDAATSASYNYSATTTAAPRPAGAALLLGALGGLALLRRHRAA